MTKKHFWEKVKVHSAAAINDVDEYAICNGEGTIIARFGGLSYNENAVDSIIRHHNSCFFEE